MSDNIFAEIYNKILSLFGQNVKDESKNTAVNRLRLVLMQDRTNLTPEIMNRMRSELIAVLSKYVELDKEALDLNIGQEGEQMALMLSIPVIRAKDEAEIEQAIKEEEEAKKAKENTEDDEDSEDESEEESEENKESEDSENSDESEPTEDVTDSKETKNEQETKEVKEETSEEDEKTDAPTSEPKESSIDEKPIPKIGKSKKNEQPSE